MSFSPEAVAERLAWMPAERRSYALAALPAHLAYSGQGERMGMLLTTLSFLEAKAGELGAQPLIDDLELALSPVAALTRRKVAELAALRDALTLSAHILTVDSARELRSQLAGRLGAASLGAVGDLQAQVMRPAHAPWLRPVAPTLSGAGGPLLRTLSGHRRAVNAMQLTADGARAVSGGADGTIRVWSLESGAEVAVLADSEVGAIDSLALVPGTVQVVTVLHSSRRTESGLGLWSLDTGELPASRSEHFDHVAVTPNGRTAVTAGFRISGLEITGTVITVWDLKRLEPIRARTVPGRITMIAITPDGRGVLSASTDDDTLKLWDLSTGREQLSLRGHMETVSAAVIAPRGDRALSVAGDSTLRVWDLRDGRLLQTLGAARGVNAFVSVALAPDGRHAVSGGNYPGHLRVWDLAKRRHRNVPEAHENRIAAISVHPDGRRIVTASFDSTLRIWDMSRIRRSRRPHHPGSIGRITIMADGRRAVISSADQPLRVWDLKRGQPVATFRDPQVPAHNVAALPDGRTVATIGSEGQDWSDWSGRIRLWDIDAGAQIDVMEAQPGSVRALAVSSDGRLAATLHELESVDIDGGGYTSVDVGIWDLSRRELVDWFSVREGGHVHRLEIEPDGQHVLVAQRAINVWSVDRPRHVTSLLCDAEPQALAVARDSGTLVSGHEDGSVRAWNVESRQERLRLVGHSGIVSAVAVTPDGRRAVSVGHDATVRLWSLTNGEALASFTGDNSLTCCAITHDGTCVVAGDVVGRVHVLRLELPHGEAR